MDGNTPPFDPNGPVWSQLSDGSMWPLIAPTADDVQLDAIAQGLANMCRFGGAVNGFISVAQHSCNVALRLREQGHDARTQLYGLLHDAHEAMVGDMTTPVQLALEELLPGFRQAFKRLKGKADLAIFKHVGLLKLFDVDEWAVASKHVHDADMACLIGERNRFCTTKHSWGEALEGTAPADVVAGSWPPVVAKGAFLSCLQGLVRELETGHRVPVDAPDARGAYPK